MCIGLHVKYRLSLSDFKNLDFSRQIFEKYSDLKFHENPSTWSRVVSCGRKDGRTDERMDRHDTLLIVA